MAETTRSRRSTAKPASKTAPAGRTTKPRTTKPAASSRAAATSSRFRNRAVVTSLGVVTLLIAGIALTAGAANALLDDAPAASPTARLDRDSRASNIEDLEETDVASACGAFGALVEQHAAALAEPPSRRAAALAQVEATVPTSDGQLALAFEHQREAIRHDIEAAAWAVAGDGEYAAGAYAAAEAESLQAEAYAGAACG